MSEMEEEGPVYYREIQKNAYLKRVPPDYNTKLRPLTNKKSALKPMWTQFCVHNGRVPFIEQYQCQQSAQAHRPIWRVSLARAKHVTASVKAWPGEEFDFMVAIDNGTVRMLAPDWESMQDWVTSLRNKLHELKILSRGENVYCSPPAAPIVVTRAGTRDPTSPLPPTPPVPPVRVPGIELNQRPEPEPVMEPAEVDDRDWQTQLAALPSTSREVQPQKLAKICGQSICLDDSILKHRDCQDDSDRLDSLPDSQGHVDSEERGSRENDYTQRVQVNGESGGENVTRCIAVNNLEAEGDYTTNITVIQVSNRQAPHSAIPVIGNVFDFDIQNANSSKEFVNIVNTDGTYGTVFDAPAAVSLTAPGTTNTTVPGTTNTTAPGTVSMTAPTTVNLTTVSLTDNSNYERLYLASTSQDRNNTESNSDYEYLYPLNGRLRDDTTQAGQVRGRRERGDQRLARQDSTESQTQAPTEGTSRLREQVLRRPQERERNDAKQQDAVTKPIWKRGLTELSLISKLKGFGQKGRPESPTRTQNGCTESETGSSVKVVHRSRMERVDGVRRRSSSLSNDSPLRSLRHRQAAALRAEQALGAAAVRVPNYARELIFCEANGAVWICRWGRVGNWCGGRAGDRIAALRGIRPRDVHHAKQLVAGPGHLVDLLFHRVPHGKIYVLTKETENESIGITLDSDCQIVAVERDSAAHRAGIPLPTQQARWAVTEINNRQINLVKGGDEDMKKLSSCGTEVSVLIQPALLVKKMRAALKSHKNLLK